jgi:hypothetical protein
MTVRRHREIKDQIERVGLRLCAMARTGGGHISAEVEGPNGARRKFIYSTEPQGDQRRTKNEEADLLRWKRNLTSPGYHEPTVMELAMANAMPSEDVLPEPAGQGGEIIGDKIARFNDTPRSDPPFTKKRIGRTITLIDRRPPPEAEPVVQDPPAPKPVAPAAAPLQEPETTTMSNMSEQPMLSKKYPEATKMTQLQVMQFSSWMNKERLEGYYTKTSFLAHASKALGFRVSETALLAWLDMFGLTMPRQPDRPLNWQDQVNDDLAAIALALSELGGSHVAAMLAIAERRTKA